MALESALVRAIRRKVVALGCACEKVHGSLYGTRGRPDLLIFVPVARLPYPIPVRVETKQRGKTPTALQRKRLRDVEKIGLVTLVASDADAVVELITILREQWGIPQILLTPQSPQWWHYKE